MALVPCPYCHESISDLAAVCPRCRGDIPRRLHPPRSWSDWLQETRSYAQRHPWCATFVVLGFVWLVIVLAGVSGFSFATLQVILLFPLVCLAALGTARAAVTMLASKNPIRDTLSGAGLLGLLFIVVWLQGPIRDVLSGAILSVSCPLIVLATLFAITVLYVRSQPFPAELVHEYRAGWYGKILLWLGVLLITLCAWISAAKLPDKTSQATGAQSLSVSAEVAPHQPPSSNPVIGWRQLASGVFFLVGIWLIRHGLTLLQWEAATRAVIENGKRESFFEFVNRNAHIPPRST